MTKISSLLFTELHNLHYCKLKILLAIENMLQVVLKKEENIVRKEVNAG